MEEEDFIDIINYQMLIFVDKKMEEARRNEERKEERDKARS